MSVNVEKDMGCCDSRVCMCVHIDRCVSMCVATLDRAAGRGLSRALEERGPRGEALTLAPVAEAFRGQVSDPQGLVAQGGQYAEALRGGVRPTGPGGPRWTVYVCPEHMGLTAKASRLGNDGIPSKAVLWLLCTEAVVAKARRHEEMSSKGHSCCCSLSGSSEPQRAALG